MQRVCFAFASLLLASAWSAPAEASGDYGCYSSWKLAHRDLSGCDNMAALGPGNDTRVNLTLLMQDARSDAAPNAPNLPTPDPLFEWYGFRKSLAPRAEGAEDARYADGEGSRCRSNPTGAAGFEAAVNAARKLSDGERTALIAARRGLQPDCAGAGGSRAALAGTANALRSPLAGAFGHYLQGAAAFYDGDYDAASAEFRALGSAGQPWLKETARYMIGRVEVNRAQIGAFDEYGYPREAAENDSAAISGAEAALRAYLKEYPRGTYAPSARGLLRRVYWLGGQTDRLTAEYAAAFVQSPAARGIDDVTLAEEVDNKLLSQLKPGAVKDPILLATLDLARMRGDAIASDGMCCGGAISREELEGQRTLFSGKAALFDFLLASHAFHVAGQPDEVLRLIPDAARQQRFGPLAFSRQMLRGMALEAKRDRNARGFWLEMLPGATQPHQRAAIELALAMNEERGKTLARVFAAGSPVRNAMIRELLLANVADAALLRQQAKDANAPRHERDVALFTLLYKGVTRGAYRDFLGDLSLVPADAKADSYLWGFPAVEQPPLGIFTRSTALGDIGCSPLRDTATRLAANPREPRGLLCLADFMRANGFDGFALDSERPRDELAGTPSLFAGGVFSRLEIYKRVIGDPKAAADDKAYALYRAVNCYGPSGNNTCGGTEVPIDQRKAWFQRLKKDYPASSWAKALRYYW
ncbi:hypothetical protein [Sphingomonas colocasiae]|uniref:Outer membrane assembly lipoprotein YfiO n=1 Tax=Sphingomonas colocasiae TaxID=1848973 RepID=A0ABS7PK38_9SPHN|nr:hypothetical protein [Sphingomonas colocasiae]MBY8821626.1 hypothetical protein [Sphingomonas colocasiae]